jgi:hypothetical protein
MVKPIIMVAGMPRTGSMWTYNVARELIRRAGHTPWPIRIPPDPIPAFRQAVLHGVAAKDVICVKVHSRFEGNLTGLKILCNLRDVRDAIVSWMRFTHCDFGSALDGFEESLALTDYYLGSSNLEVCPVRYEDLMHRPAETVLRVGAFIGFPVTLEVAEVIAAAYSRDNVRRRTSEIEHSRDETSSRTGRRIRNPDGSVRAYDESTGFQTGHVSDSRGGEWRELLNESQRTQLATIVNPWLLRHGYAV